MIKETEDSIRLFLIELLKSLSESGIWRAAGPEAVIVAFIEADTDFSVNAKSLIKRHY